MNKLLLLLAFAVLVAWWWAPLDSLPELLEWVRGRGFEGVLIIGAIYVAATVLMIPGSILGLAIGAVFGPWWGLLIVSPASVLGATIAFLLGRGLLLARVEKKMVGSRRFDALSTAIEREGFKVLVLIRLSPVFPFTVVNYAFGLTRLKLPTYVLGSFIGMLPGTFMYVYLGAMVGDVALLASGQMPTTTPAETTLKWVGLVATVVVTVLVTRIARRKLSAEVSESK